MAIFQQTHREYGLGSFPELKNSFGTARLNLASSVFSPALAPHSRSHFSKCHLPSDSAKRLAEFYPASYLKKTNPFAQSQIVVYPEGQALLDDILVTSLIIERLRLIPSGSEGKALFSYRQQVDTNLI